MSRIKGLVSMLIVFNIFTLSFVVSAYADDNEFVINNGVLLQYNGNSANVTIPKGVFEIAADAFENNAHIENLDLSDRVVYIGDHAFFGCNNLRNISGSDNVSKIGAQAFENTKWFNNITTDVKMLNNVVIGCKSELETAEIPDNALSVAPMAFYGNHSIKRAICGKNLEEIGDLAFCGCTALSEIVLGERISYIGKDAFKDTNWLNHNMDEFTVVNGILVKCSSDESDVTLPYNVKQIAGGAFYNDKSLKSIVLPVGLYYIGDSAFAFSNLKKINLADSNVIYIGKNAFEGCSALTEIELNKKISYIGENAFKDCADLKINVDPESYAYNYVVENGLNHSIAGILGDLDGDGALTMVDVVTLQKYIAKLIPLTIEATRLADIDQSGDITMQDVTYMQRRIAGLI